MHGLVIIFSILASSLQQSTIYHKNTMHSKVFHFRLSVRASIQKYNLVISPLQHVKYACTYDDTELKFSFELVLPHHRY